MKQFYLLAIACILFTNLSAQQINFAPKEKLFDQPNPGLFDFGVQPLDFDRDGDMDYITRAIDELVVYESTDDGFVTSEDLSQDPFSRPFDFLDFDQDGNDDIIMESYIYLFDEATGDYNPLYYNDAENEFTGINAIVDFDNNGFNDILTTVGIGSNPSMLTIYFWDGVDFNAVPLDFDTRVGSISIADLEGDGDMDIAFVNGYENESPIILVNDGSGDFETRTVFGFKALNNRTMEFRDFDNDGDADIFCNTFNNELLIYENTNNFLTPPFQYEVGDRKLLASRVADFDGDGLNEIVCLSFDESSFSLLFYKNEGGLEFGPPQVLTTFATPGFFLTLNPNYLKNTLKLVDVDFDSDLDVIVTFGIGDNPAIYFVENIGAGIVSTNEIEVLETKVYPNPTSDYISITTPLQSNAQFTIFDVNGKVVKRGQYQEKINVSGLVTGLYNLFIKDSKEHYTSQFVIGNY